MPAIRREVNTGMRYAFLIGFPCSVGMSVLAKQIVYFFYGSVSKFTPEKLQLASELLTFSAMTVVLFTVVQATSSILQGLRKQKIPMYTMSAGVAVKILLNYILIGTKGIDIHGGPIASIACYSLVMIVNTVYMCKHAKMRFRWLEWLIRPGIASACMGMIVWITKKALPGGRISTILCVIVGILSYFAVAVLVKAVSKEDLHALVRRRKKA